MNIPNALTVIRFFLIPLFVYFYMYTDMTPVSVAIFVISGLTDVLDGYIARKYNMQTNWGAVFDPIADKATQIVTVLCIALKGIFVMWFAFYILLVKEMLMILGGITLYRRRDIVVNSNKYGKAATALFYLVILSILCAGDIIPGYITNIMVASTLVLSMTSGIIYVIHYVRKANEIKRQKNHN